MTDCVNTSNPGTIKNRDRSIPVKRCRLNSISRIASILKALGFIIMALAGGGPLGGILFSQSIEERRNPLRGMDLPASISDPRGLEEQIAFFAAKHQRRVKGGVLAIGLVRGGVVREFYYGPDAKLIDDTRMKGMVFELASVTKTFTALAVAKMVAEKRLSLSSRVGEVVPNWSLSLPVSRVTLEMLLTQHSGFPRIPGNLKLTNPSNPYSSYSRDDLKEVLSTLKLSSQGQYLYSNFGFGVLGEIVSNHEGVEFGALIEREVLHPLSLKSTFPNRHSIEDARIMQPLYKGKATPIWDRMTLGGSGGFLATLTDVSKYTQFMCGGLRVKSIEEPRQMVIQKRAGTNLAYQSIGLGWHIDSINELEVRWHSGATKGSNSYIGFIESSAEGIVVLSNSEKSVKHLAEELIHFLHYHVLDSALQ